MSEKKRVYEIAKDEGLPSANVLQRLQRAGMDVKTASSTVDVAWAMHILSPNRNARPEGEMPQPEPKKKAAPRKTKAAEPVAEDAPAPPAPEPVAEAAPPAPVEPAAPA
ncbi:MAG: translation initiation factor IF-2 N-terminal domain-containing protein, partial [Thermoleophilia bacterium]|nr:translation initiation factor IF-2 N-terminal domain-containing protein [Thermoleophilia bacterium]